MEGLSAGQQNYLKLKQSAFKQNELATWRPGGNSYQTFVLFMALGILFALTGVAYVVLSSMTQTVTVPYSGSGDILNVTFTVPEKMSPPINVYYTLTNMHQNYRRFAASKSIDQLFYGEGKHPSDAKFCYPVTREIDRSGTPFVGGRFSETK